MVLLVTAACHQVPKEHTVMNSQNKQEIITENILTRRAIRKYTDKQVSKTQLDTIIQCAVYAPSALNRQSWEVRFIRNPGILEEINNRFLEYAKGKTLIGSASRAGEPGFSVFHHAPVLVVVGKDKSNSYSTLDCGLLTQNILLSAHALGLGTCPIGAVVPILNDGKNRDLLEQIAMPDTHDIAICIALGYPDEKPVPKERNKDKIQIID